MAWNPQSNALWTVVNERDMLGSDLAPDYLTMVDFGAFYGWPYTYWGGYVDKRVEERPDLQQYTRRPDYALGPHTASLGLAFGSLGGVPERRVHRPARLVEPRAGFGLQGRIRAVRRERLPIRARCVTC